MLRGPSILGHVYPWLTADQSLLLLPFLTLAHFIASIPVKTLEVVVNAREQAKTQ
jgi:hypothetical protein